MKRTLFTFAVFLLILAMLTGCAATAGPPAQRPVTQVNPAQEAAAADSVPVRLYFGYLDEEWLCGEAREIDIPVNGRIETAVVRALIDGPLAISPALTGLISPDTEVVAVSDSGEFLFVTLSSEFLDYPEAANDPESPDYEAAMGVRRLAVQSIVNTLTELGGCSRVQVLVDTEGTGRGQRISAIQAGFDRTGTLEPLMRDPSVILGTQNTMTEFLKAYSEKNWERLYDFVAQQDDRGNRPGYDAFMAETVSLTAGLSEYEVIETTVSPDGLSAVAFVSYTCTPSDGEAYRRENMPLPMVMENSVWKVAYSALNELA